MAFVQSIPDISGMKPDPEAVASTFEHAPYTHQAFAFVVMTALPWFEHLPTWWYVSIIFSLGYRIVDTLLHPDFPRYNPIFKPVEWLVRQPFRLLEYPYQYCNCCRNDCNDDAPSPIQWTEWD